MAVEKYSLPALPYALDVSLALKPSQPGLSIMLPNELVPSSTPIVPPPQPTPQLTPPPLPKPQALEPSISAQIMDLHYNRHHQTYITNLNSALQSQAEALRTNDLLALLALQPLIKFHAGGHINHTLFWASLCPPTSSPSSASTTPLTTLTTKAPTLSAALITQFTSLPAFFTAFTSTALSLQGSGWIWLLRDASERTRLSIAVSKDQDLPAGVAEGTMGVLLGLDMWEHAYYLQYWNDKKSYVEGWWRVVDWAVVERRFGVQGDVRGVLVDCGVGGLVGRL